MGTRSKLESQHAQAQTGSRQVFFRSLSKASSGKGWLVANRMRLSDTKKPQYILVTLLDVTQQPLGPFGRVAVSCSESCSVSGVAWCQSAAV